MIIVSELSTFKQDPHSNSQYFPFKVDELVSIDCCGISTVMYQTKTALYIGRYSPCKLKNFKITLLLRLTPSYFVKKVVGGWHHTFILMSNGEILGFGENKFGQISIEDRECYESLRLVPSSTFGGEKVRDIVCGALHTMVLTESGAIFACGNNEFNQIEYVPKEDPNVPMVSCFKLVKVRKHWNDEVPNENGGKDLKIVKLVAGAFHTVFLTENGIVYGVGKENLGKQYPHFAPLEPFCSGASSTNIDMAFPISANKFVTNVWCGFKSTFVQTIEDEIYVCASEGFYMEHFFNKDKDISFGFERCEFLSGKKIREMVGFKKGMIAISESRDVFVSGWNVCKQLSVHAPFDIVLPQYEPFLTTKLKENPMLDYTITCNEWSCSLYFSRYDRRTRNESDFFEKCKMSLDNYFSDIELLVND